jgi:excisionase family DNA binding protein
MADTHGTYQRVSVLEAARILGISPTTVRRMVKAGTLQAERVLRPQGHTFVVLVPSDSQPDATTRQQVSAEARTEVPPSEQAAVFAASILTPVLAPLMLEQAEQIGTLRAENESLQAQNAALLASTAGQPSDPSPGATPAA